MITVFIITIVSLLIGFWLGHSSKPVDDVKTGLSQLFYKGKDIAKTMKYRDIKAGPVQRPSPQRLNELHHPEIIEQKEEMKRVLQEGVDPLTPVI